MKYSDAVRYLFSLQKFGIKLGLSSTENLLSRMGRPQDNLPCLHLAGTNGKGSVGAAIVSILSRAGYKIGFFTSPHLVSFRERFVISQNGESRMISEEEVIGLTKFVDGVCAHEEPPTFFEFVTAMALQFFADQKVDLAVMETGLGGRLDATNVITPLAAVITNISLEHTEYLGNTLTDIAREKAGIIKPKIPVITGEKRPRIRDIFESRTAELGGELFVFGRDFKRRASRGGGFDYYGIDRCIRNLNTALPGEHQIINASIALATLEALAERGYDFGEIHAREGLENVSWPGRGEIFPGQPRLMLDGAHNPAAAKALAAMLAKMDVGRVRLVIGVMSDKDISGVLHPLSDLAHEIYLTRPAYFRAADPEALRTAITDFPGKIEAVGDIPTAIEAARSSAGPEDLVLVTGSLFMVGEARSYLTGVPQDGLTG